MNGILVLLEKEKIRTLKDINKIDEMISDTLIELEGLKDRKTEYKKWVSLIEESILKLGDK